MVMKKTDIIRAKLETAIAPLQLKIADESAKHAGHAGARAGGETHFRIEIVAEKFNGLTSIARHRMVNEALKDLFSDGLHALEIQAKSPGELK